MKMQVGNKIISKDSPCFVIAEIGHNHQGNISTAIKMIDEAASTGADAVKLQKRFNKSLYTKEMYKKPYENENSFGKTYGEHRDALEFGETEYLKLKDYAESKDIVFFSTAFDFESVDFLEKIGVPAYKIASGDITNHPLIDYIGQTGKPVFISTGACSMEDVRSAYDVLKKRVNEICLMQCTASYPAQPEDINLNVITTYIKEFPHAIIGYSGHDSGIVIPVVAYVLGARVVEKHFTLNRTMKGTDHKFSHTPAGLKKMIRDLKRVRAAMGMHEKKCLSIEKDAKSKMGKSIVLSRNSVRGEIVERELITFKSPGIGIPPSRIEEIIGKKLRTDLPEETILTMDHLE